MIKRYLQDSMILDLKKKMVFISGPRQVGKTTLAKQIGESDFTGAFDYLNWDYRQDRTAILKGEFLADKKLRIYDEIHKYRGWKNYLKGEFDKKRAELHFLVTGSARLDVFRKGGDSLLGRYHSYHLHPLSLAELSGNEMRETVPFRGLEFHEPSKQSAVIFQDLLKYGGFPEVFVSKNEKDLRRWHNERVDRLIKEDIRDMENLRDISSLQVLVELLPAKVGSLLSLNSLREDLQVAHKTISSWMDILEKFYYHYRIYPYQSTRIKSLRKEPKLYLWDWSEIQDENIRLENMMASALLKFRDYLIDVEGYKAQLFFLRDKEQREVDFLFAVGGKPWFCVEVKKSDKSISKSIYYFKSRLKIPFAYQVIGEENVDFVKDDIRVLSASKFMGGLL